MGNEEHSEQEEREPEATDQEGLEFEEAISELERVESKRRRMGVVLGVGALVLLVAALVLVAQFRSALFRPKMPIEESQREIILKTDDPQCRKLIADVTNIGNTFFAMEGRIEKHLPGGEPAAIRKVIEDLDTIHARVTEAEELSKEATLRFEKSREELERWFDFVDGELELLEEIAKADSADAGAMADAGDAGDNQADAGASADAGEATDKADAGPTVTELRNSTLVALHEAFQNFRVWHSASLHPCGDNDEGETPWRPDDWEADAGRHGEEKSRE